MRRKKKAFFLKETFFSFKKKGFQNDTTVVYSISPSPHPFGNMTCNFF